MRVSVVIPTFRRPELLRRCLYALQEQDFDYNEYEVLVVSDGPDESTQKVLSDFCADRRFRCLHMLAKRGPAAARNYGWKKANGILVAFTDDDTIPDKNWLAAFWNNYKNEKEIAYTGKTIVPLPDDPTDYQKNTAGLERAEFVTANCCCTKAALEKTGGFDERFSMAWREDSDLQFQLMLNNIPIVAVPAAIVVHPVREAEWGVSIREQMKGMFNALLYKKYPRLYRQKIQPSPLWNYYLMVVSALVFLTAMIAGALWLAGISFLLWFMLLAAFVYKRLKHTSKNPSHVMEMIFTSACIPFISVYWHLYGAWKYRVLFL